MSFSPMLACSNIPRPEQIKFPVYASFKLDGIRCAIVNGHPLSRTLKPIPNRFIRHTLNMPCLRGLDGELMIKGDFNAVQSAVMSHSGKPEFVYYVFDDFSDPRVPFD